jgi:nucleoside-diphosphate-sugar epimerase
MSKVLITGASGFVGSFLVEEALERGFDVYAGIRNSSSRKFLQDKRIRFFNIDLSSRSQLEKALKKEKFDYIIQNAGVTKAKNEDTYYRVNAQAVDDFVQVLKHMDAVPEKFVMISSLAAFGPADNKEEDLVTRQSQPQPVTVYGRSKLRGEQLLRQHEGFPYSIIRPTAVYGPREEDLLTVYKMINLKLELMIGNQDQRLTFVYVKDLVRAILDVMIMSKKRSDYFVTDGNVYSATEFNDEIKKLLKTTTLKLKLPVSLVRIMAILSEKMSSLSGNYPALNLEKVKELECRSWECDISNLKEDINFQPAYSLSEGLKETIDWYKLHNIL